MSQLKELAKYVSERLLDKGFIVQRYDAYSTDSIYLKLDYGAANSIRISNHPGKKHLRYRYNITLDGQTEDVMDTYIRHYYKPDDVDSMLETIVEKKKEDMLLCQEKVQIKNDFFSILPANSAGKLLLQF